MTGYGKKRWSEKEIYQGEWLNGKRNGHGRY
jgi:hypothetical protein